MIAIGDRATAACAANRRSLADAVLLQTRFNPPLPPRDLRTPPRQRMLVARERAGAANRVPAVVN